MSHYAETLKQQFLLVVEADQATADDLLAVYDQSYISITEAFIECADVIYVDMKRMQSPHDASDMSLTWEDIHGKDPEELLALTHTYPEGEDTIPDSVYDYLESIRVLCEYDPENFSFEGPELDALREAFKESLMLASSHIHEKLAFRNITSDVRSLYYDTVEELNRTFEAL